MVLNIFITFIQWKIWIGTPKTNTLLLPEVLPVCFSDTAPLKGRETTPKAELPWKCQIGLLRQWSWITHFQLLCLTGSIIVWPSFSSPGWNDFHCSLLLDCFNMCGIAKSACLLPARIASFSSTSTKDTSSTLSHHLPWISHHSPFDLAPAQFRNFYSYIYRLVRHAWQAIPSSPHLPI